MACVGLTAAAAGALGSQVDEPGMRPQWVVDYARDRATGAVEGVGRGQTRHGTESPGSDDGGSSGRDGDLRHRSSFD